MGIEDRLAAIEKNQKEILRLLAQNERSVPEILTLKKAAEYVGFSSHHFRWLAVEQRVIPFSRPSGQQKGKLLFRKLDLDRFLDESVKAKESVRTSGRKRKSTDICFWWSVSVMGDDSFLRGLKGLDPNFQKKIIALNDNPKLPQWPEQTRGIPNICLRSALFGIIQRGQRRALKGELISSVKGLEIRYTGWQLDQGDFDVLAHALHLVATNKSSEGYVQFTVKGFLHGIYRKAGKSGREWLKDCFRRLTGTAVEIKLEIKYTYEIIEYVYAGSLIDEFYCNTHDQTYFLKVNPKLAKLFDAGWTQLQWQQRTCLKTDLAKWLHGFYASHRSPYPMKVLTLKTLCGSSCGRLADFRRKLRIALEELCHVQLLSSWKIDQEDKVHVQKSVSKQFNDTR
ncbi:MAG: hypothetical protein JKY62_15935 [Desulfocapsa sp.]|nr:hypothetical protein [Desulfocapsa sp.]